MLQKTQEVIELIANDELFENNDFKGCNIEEINNQIDNINNECKKYMEV